MSLRTILMVAITAPSTVAVAQVTSFCPAVPNSTGAAAALAATGSLDVSANSLTLHCAGLPNNSFGMFLASNQSQAAATTPANSTGNLCLGAGFGMFRGDVRFTGATQDADLALDLASVPLAAGSTAVLGGDTWLFQYWYRDRSVAGAPTTNFSDGVEIQFDAPVARFTFDVSTVGLRYTSFLDVSAGNPMDIDWDFDFTGNPADPAAGFVAMVAGMPGASTSHDFSSTGAVSVAMRARYANGAESYHVDTVDVTAVVFADVIGPLRTHCGSCHGASAGLDFNIGLADAYDDLVGVPATVGAACSGVPGALRVDPYDLNNSFLWGISAATAATCASMSNIPAGSELDALRDWIEHGAAFD